MTLATDIRDAFRAAYAEPNADHDDWSAAIGDELALVLGGAVVKVKSVCRVLLDSDVNFTSAGLEVPWSDAPYDPDGWFNDGDPDDDLQVPSGLGINYVLVIASLTINPTATSDRFFGRVTVDGNTTSPFRAMNSKVNDGATSAKYLPIFGIVEATSANVVNINIDRDGASGTWNIGGTSNGSQTHATFLGLEIG